MAAIRNVLTQADGSQQLDDSLSDELLGRDWIKHHVTRLLDPLDPRAQILTEWCDMSGTQPSVSPQIWHFKSFCVFATFSIALSTIPRSTIFFTQIQDDPRTKWQPRCCGQISCKGPMIASTKFWSMMESKSTGYSCIPLFQSLWLCPAASVQSLSVRGYRGRCRHRPADFHRNMVQLSFKPGL